MFDFLNSFDCIDTGKKGTASLRKLARARNSIEYQNTLARTIRDALSRYHFENLPETMSERVILQSLALYGQVIAFERMGQWFMLPGGATEDFNMYGDPKYGYVWGRNGFTERVRLFVPGGDESNFLNEGLNSEKGGTPHGVFIRENAICFPFVRYAIEYAQAIADSMRTLDVCRQNIKQPYIVVAEEMLIPTVKEFFKQRNENVETIVSSGVFPADKINILPFETNAQNLKNSTDMIEWYWNQWNLLCGSGGNANADKKERLLVDEVNANNESSESYTDNCIQYIQQGLDILNKVAGLNIKCVTSHQQEEQNGILELPGDNGGENSISGSGNRRGDDN